MNAPAPTLRTAGLLLLMNAAARKGAKLQIKASWAQVGLPPNVSAHVRDVWAGRDLGTFAGGFSAAFCGDGDAMPSSADTGASSGLGNDNLVPGRGGSPSASAARALPPRHHARAARSGSG